jgi:hypothetical protein
MNKNPSIQLFKEDHINIQKYPEQYVKIEATTISQPIIEPGDSYKITINQITKTETLYVHKTQLNRLMSVKKNVQKTIPPTHL